LEFLGIWGQAVKTALLPKEEAAILSNVASTKYPEVKVIGSF